MTDADTWTPGRYLRMRRRAAGMSIAEVAHHCYTEPRVPEHDRAALLEQIEADEASGALTVAVAAAYKAAGVRYDPEILVALVAPRTFPLPPICRSCGCSERDPCLTTIEPVVACRWLSEDLCSFCPGEVPGLAAAA